MCTQPRRISAVGLAGRVAEERRERVGETVGYSVRLESKRGEGTRLLFCTTGVLLRAMLGDATLQVGACGRPWGAGTRPPCARSAAPLPPCPSSPLRSPRPRLPLAPRTRGPLPAPPAPRRRRRRT